MQVMGFLLKVKRAKFVLDKARRWMWKVSFSSIQVQISFVLPEPLDICDLKDNYDSDHFLVPTTLMFIVSPFRVEAVPRTTTSITG